MLYLEHFGLNEPPFRITPHTDFFFDGADRGATLDALLYAILHDEGIVKVSGEVGSGKTMLCRVLMERLPENVEIVYLANPSLARDEILHAIAEDLQVEFSQGRITVALRNLLDCLIGLYADNRRVVILIDEAHAMPAETLEQVRLLSNLESNQHKLLQIVLFGQPELDNLLGQASMRQLKDRITHSFRMRPLQEAEVGKYLSFRMRAAGYRGPDVFSRKAVAMIAKGASGLTRRVNILADKALLAAFTVDSHAVSGREVRTAIRDSEFGRLLGEKERNPLLFAAAALFAGLVIGAGLYWGLTREQGNAGHTGSIGTPPRTPLPGASPMAKALVPAPAPLAGDAVPATNAPAVPPTGVNQDLARDSIKSVVKTEVTTVTATAPTISIAASRQSLLPADAITRISAFKVGDNILLKQRIASTLERLKHEPDSSYSIELYTTENSDPARMERFLIRAREMVPLENVYIVPEAGGKAYRLRVTVGSFPDRAAAMEAAEHLPPKYKQAFQTQMRSFSELREAL